MVVSLPPFRAWLNAQVLRADATGDFARDWLEDPTAPKYPMSEKDVMDHLRDKHAESAAYIAGKVAWFGYRRWLKRETERILEARAAEAKL